MERRRMRIRDEMAVNIWNTSDRKETNTRLLSLLLLYPPRTWYLVRIYECGYEYRYLSLYVFVPVRTYMYMFLEPKFRVYKSQVFSSYVHLPDTCTCLLFIALLLLCLLLFLCLLLAFFAPAQQGDKKYTYHRSNKARIKCLRYWVDHVMYRVLLIILVYECQ